MRRTPLVRRVAASLFCVKSLGPLRVCRRARGASKIARAFFFSHLRHEKTIAEKYLARHFLGIQESVGSNESESAYWPPGTENQAGGSAKVKGDMAPMLRVLKSVTFCPGVLRPLRGASSRGVGSA